MLQVFYLDVTYILQYFSSVFSFFKCFRRMFQVFHLSYVTNILSGYFKSRSGVAHIAIMPVVDRQQAAAGLRLLPGAGSNSVAGCRFTHVVGSGYSNCQ
jgi:hypothetical protein